MQVNVARALLPRPPLPSALPSQPTPLTVRILPTVTVVVTASGNVTLHRSLRRSRAPRPTCRVPAVQPEAARAARRDTLPRCRRPTSGRFTTGRCHVGRDEQLDSPPALPSPPSPVRRQAPPPLPPLPPLTSCVLPACHPPGSRHARRSFRRRPRKWVTEMDSMGRKNLMTDSKKRKWGSQPPSPVL